MAMTTKPEAPAGRRGKADTAQGRIGGGLLDPKILWQALPDAFKKLDPRVQIKNPVMFVVEIGAALCVGTAIAHTRSEGASCRERVSMFV
jgi:potassium-transporting ATPase ATP-binding subunit